MAKQLKCGDLMPGCDFVATGATEAEVLEKAAAHAKTAHGLQQVTPELAASLSPSIEVEVVDARRDRTVPLPVPGVERRK